MPRPRTLVSTVVVLAGLLTLAAVTMTQSGSDADHRYRLTGWGSEASLAIRSDRAAAVLLAPGTRFDEPPVGADRVAAYRLDLTTMTMQPVPEEDWMRASGPIVRCESAGIGPRTTVRFDAGELRIGSRTVTVAGSIRDARVSPDGRRLAVLTASGVRLPRLSPIPTLGRGGIAGERYHQTVDMASATPVGQRIALGFGVSDPMVCWSPGGEVVVYADPAFTEVAVIDVRRGGQ